MVVPDPYPQKAKPLRGRGVLQDGAIRDSPRTHGEQSPSLPIAQCLGFSLFRTGLRGVKLPKPPGEDKSISGLLEAAALGP